MTRFFEKSEKEEPMLLKQNKSLALGLVHLLCHCRFAEQLGGGNAVLLGLS